VREPLRRARLPGGRAPSRPVVRPGRVRAQRPGEPRTGAGSPSARCDRSRAARPTRDDGGVASSHPLHFPDPRRRGDGDPVAVPVAARVRKRRSRDPEDALALTGRAARGLGPARGAREPTACGEAGEEAAGAARQRRRRGQAGLGHGLSRRRKRRGSLAAGAGDPAAEPCSEPLAAARFSARAAVAAVPAAASSSPALTATSDSPAATAATAATLTAAAASPSAGSAAVGAAPGASDHDGEEQGIQAGPGLRRSQPHPHGPARQGQGQGQGEEQGRGRQALLAGVERALGPAKRLVARQRLDHRPELGSPLAPGQGEAQRA
jgi:hypothetical protein